MTEAVLQGVPPRPARVLTRPQLILAGMVAITVCLLGGMVAVMALAPAWQASVRAIGLDTEPSIAAALRMRTALSDMDADALSDAIGDNGAAIATSNSFREAAATLDALLLDMGSKATASADGTKKALVSDMQRFLRLYGEALGEARWAGFSSAQLGASRAKWASQLLNSSVRPAAEELDATSSAAFNREFELFHADANTRLAQLAGIALVPAGVPLLCLIVLQVGHARRARRLFNVPLAAASLVVAATGGWLALDAVRVQDEIHAAWQDDFGVLYGIQYARMNVHELRAKRAQWLFDPATRDATASDTADLVELLLGIPRPPRPGAPPVVDSGRPPPTGLFGDLLAWTEGFSDSRGDLEQARELLVTYLQGVGTARGQGGRAGVAGYGLGTPPDQVATVFHDMEAAMADALAVTEKRFAVHVEDALHLTQSMPTTAAAGFGLALLLALLGLWQRYRVFL